MLAPQQALVAFFAAIGHSMHVARIVWRVRLETRRRLPGGRCGAEKGDHALPFLSW